MARASYGSIITDLKGSVGGITFQRNPSGKIARLKPTASVNPSNLQSGRERMLAYLASYWSSLTISQKNDWNALAATHDHYDPWGNITKLNGFQQFQSNNINLSVINTPLIPDAPVYLLPPPPPAFTLNFSSSSIYLEFITPYDPSPYDFVLYVTPPLRQSNINTRKNYFLLTGGSWTSSTVFDITVPYLAYFNIFYPLFLSSVDCTIIARCCVIDPVTGFRSSSSFHNAKPVQQNPFIFTVDTTKPGISSNCQFQLPLYNGGTYSFYIDWGDNSSDTITAWNQAETLHTYSVPGIYTIGISGTFIGITNFLSSDKYKWIDILNWGCFQPGNYGHAFESCVNLECHASDILNLSGVTNCYYFFYECYKFNCDLSLCDVSTVTNMGLMFYRCSIFNSDLSNWNVENVTNMTQMFHFALAFRCNLSKWIITWCEFLDYFISYTDMTADEYSAMLVAWSALPHQYNLNFGAHGVPYYFSAASAHLALTSSPSNWAITDAGPI
jgi:surface protein